MKGLTSSTAKVIMWLESGPGSSVVFHGSGPGPGRVGRQQESWNENNPESSAQTGREKHMLKVASSTRAAAGSGSGAHAGPLVALSVAAMAGMWLPDPGLSADQPVRWPLLNPA